MNPKYIAGLSPQQRIVQLRLLRKSKKEYADSGKIIERPKVSDQKTPRSSWVKKFQEKHGFPITDLQKVKLAYPNADIDTILKKGAGAYASSGSRPNVSSYAWRYSR